MFQTFQVSQEKEDVAHLFKELCYFLWPACSAFSFLCLLACVVANYKLCVNFNQQQDKRGPATEWGFIILSLLCRGGLVGCWQHREFKECHKRIAIEPQRKS